MPANLSFAIGLEPTKAIEYFDSKGYQVGWNWQDVYADAHSRAFTVAGIMKQDILEDIRASLSEALKNGESFDTWRNKIEPMLEAKGWMGKGFVTDPATGEIHGRQLGPRRLSTIYRTNMQSSMMAGRYQAQLANADQRPYWMYVKNTERHAKFDAITLPYDDPFWATFYPPNGYFCWCRVRTLSAKEVERRGLTISSSEDCLVEVDQIINQSGETRKAIGYRNPITGKVITADPSFGFSPGREHLGNLGQHLLNRSAVADSRIAAMAVDHTLSNPKLIAAVSDDLSKMVTRIATDKVSRGEFMHVGALSVFVLDALKAKDIAPASVVISVSGDNLLHAIRDNKTKALPLSFWQQLPIKLRQPEAVLLERNQGKSALLYVYPAPDGKGKLVVTMDYSVRVRNPETNKKEAIKTNMVQTGTVVSDVTTLTDSIKYELLWGDIK